MEDDLYNMYALHELSKKFEVIQATDARSPIIEEIIKRIDLMKGGE